MRTVKNVNELRVNIKTLDGYIAIKKEPEYDFALNLVKKGTCFVAVKENGTYKFYPSRFVGYFNNNMDAHQNNNNKDGRETNPAISTVLGSYREYCESLGFIANEKGSFGVERKYWEL